MAEKDAKIVCFLCGREGKCVDAKTLDESLEGFAICPIGTGCQEKLEPIKK